MSDNELSSTGPAEEADPRARHSGVASSDLASSDLASSDLASSDLASSDIASSDLASSDIATDDRFEALIEGLDAIVWEMDVSNWMFTYVSGRAEELLGYPVERWLTEPGFWSDVIVDESDRGWAVDFCASATRDARDHSFEYRARAADGHIVWLRDVVRVVRDEEGEASLLRGVMLDITEQKETEAVLREREQHAALWADIGLAVSQGGEIRDILQRCSEAVVQRLNAAFARVWTLNELENVLELQASAGMYTHLDGGHARVPVGSFKIGKIAAERTPHLTNDVLNDPRVSDHEWARREGMASFAGYPLLVEDRVVGVVAMFARHPLSDGVLAALRGVAERLAMVVEREQTTRALRLRERQLAEAQEIASLGSWEWPVGAEHVLWSDELYRIFGVPAGTAVSFDLYSDLLHPEDRRRVLGAIEAAVERGGGYEFEHRVTRPDRTVRYVYSRGEVDTDREGRPVRLFGVAQDITERHASLEREHQLALEQVARAQAEASQGRITRILESITDAFFAVDRQWRFTYVNREGEALLQRPAGELLGRNLWKEFPDAVGSRFETSYRQALEERQTVEFEEYFEPLGAWFEVRAYPSDEGLSVYFRNVTERKRLEDRQAFLASAGKILASSLDYDTTLRSVAQLAVSSLADWCAIDLVGEDDTLRRVEVAHPDPARRQLALQIQEEYPPDPEAPVGVHQVLRTGEPQLVEHIPDALLAEVAVNEEHHQALRDLGLHSFMMVPLSARGRTLGVITLVSGETRRPFDEEDLETARELALRAGFAVDNARLVRRTEEALREVSTERGRLKELFMQAPAFITVLEGPEHVFEMANTHYTRMVGDRDVVGRPVAEALPEVADQGFIDLLDQVYRTGEPYVGREVPIMLRRGGEGLEQAYLNFVYQPIRDALGAVTGIFVHGVEVTDQVLARTQVEEKARELAELAQALEQSNRALEQSNRELDQFAYVASHDLKAPLRGIANLSQWIEEDLGDDVPAETREQLDLLRGRVHRMEGLIDGILEFSRAGRVRDAIQEVDVGELLDGVLDMLSPPEGVAIQVQGDMPTLRTERLPLEQVFMNLIGNAIKYTDPADARIQVAARDGADGSVEFSVSDNGPGIAPEYHDRIFGIFQTLHSRDEIEGTGIGLSLVRKIVEARGGRVRVESSEGEGATFRFSWPRDVRSAEQSEETSG